MPTYYLDIQLSGYSTVVVDAENTEEAFEKVFLDRGGLWPGVSEYQIDWDGAFEQIEQDTFTAQDDQGNGVYLNLDSPNASPRLKAYFGVNDE